MAGSGTRRYCCCGWWWGGGGCAAAWWWSCSLGAPPAIAAAAARRHPIAGPAYTQPAQGRVGLEDQISAWKEGELQQVVRPVRRTCEAGEGADDLGLVLLPVGCAVRGCVRISGGGGGGWGGGRALGRGARHEGVERGRDERGSEGRVGREQRAHEQQPRLGVHGGGLREGRGERGGRGRALRVQGGQQTNAPMVVPLGAPCSRWLTPSTQAAHRLQRGRARRHPSTAARCSQHTRPPDAWQRGSPGPAPLPAPPFTCCAA